MDRRSAELWAEGKHQTEEQEPGCRKKSPCRNLLSAHIDTMAMLKYAKKQGKSFDELTEAEMGLFVV